MWGAPQQNEPKKNEPNQITSLDDKYPLQLLGSIACLGSAFIYYLYMVNGIFVMSKSVTSCDLLVAKKERARTLKNRNIVFLDVLHRIYLATRRSHDVKVLYITEYASHLS